MPAIRMDSGMSNYPGIATFGPTTCTETSSGQHREFWSDLTASSAVNLPINRASLRLGVIWMGVRSIRCTYSVARVLARFTFHNKFCVHDFHKCLRCCQALKEVLAMHGPRSSPSIDPVFPNSREADILPFFSGHSNFGYGRFSTDQKRLSRVLDSMAGLITGTRDALTRFTQPLTGSYYFVPSVESLRSLR
jgi:hypothetical protein